MGVSFDLLTLQVIQYFVQNSNELQLYNCIHFSIDGTEKDIYVNPAVNSPFGCRPLRYATEPENQENMNKERERLEKEVEKLDQFKNDKVIVTFKGIKSLLDGIES